MAQRRVRIGIIGASTTYGWGFRAHLPALMALPEYELEAVCTAHQETAEAAKAKYEARLAFHDHREMVRHPDVDMVTVNVKVPYHYELTRDALNAGKHVYCEWPLGANLRETEELADLARAKGVRTMIGLQGRASPHFLRLKELIEEGYVGKVLSCHLTQFTQGALQRPSSAMWSADKSKGVNTLTIGFAHTVDAFCMAVGQFRELSAVVGTQVKQLLETDTNRTVNVTSPDNVQVSGTLENGAVASVHIASVPAHPSGVKAEVYGDKGTLVLTTDGAAQMSSPRLLGGKAGSNALEELTISEHLRWVPKEVPQGAPYNVAQMYRRFAEAVRTGKRVEPDFDTAVMRHKFIEAVQRASDTGQRQRV